MKGTYILLAIVAFILVMMLRYKPEMYEPQNMGSRRYWGFGRENAYSIFDHHEDHGPCYQASQNEYRECLPGYTRHYNKVLDQIECCVNLANY